jgi:subtilisin family serine protease
VGTREVAVRPAVPGPGGFVAGAGTALAVLDSGFSAGHPALRAVPVAGARSFVAGDPLADPLGHGTECCGTVVARPVPQRPTGRATGPARVVGVPMGVAPGARLYVGQVLTAAGQGDLDALCAGLEWAAALDVDVIALPLGCRRGSPRLHRAIEAALARGALVVAAVGNPRRGQQSPLYPAAYPGVVAVGADRYRDTYPDWTTPPDVVVTATDPRVCTPDGGSRSAADTSHATARYAGLLCARIGGRLRA